MFLSAFVATFAFAQLVPEPIRVEMRERDSFGVTVATPVVVDEELREHMPIINDAARMDLRVLDTRSAKEDAIYIGVAGRFAPFAERRLRRKIEGLIEPPAHGYRLIIEDDVVIIAGADTRGAIKGMHTLAQMIRGNDPLPGVEILDGPVHFDRGVRYSGRPPISLIAEASGMKADFLVTDSNAFWDAERRQDLEPLLTRATLLGLGVVPQIRPLDDVGRLLETRPELAPTQLKRVNLVLRGEQMVPLPIRSLPVSRALAPSVAVSGVPMVYKEDYAFDQEAPGSALTIRRLVGSAIPDGATVTISYQEPAAGQHGLSLAAPGAGEALADVARAIANEFDPYAIHVGPGDIDIVALDGRARASGKTMSELLGDLYAPLIEWDDAPTLVIDGRAHGLLPKAMQRKFVSMGDGGAAWHSIEMNVATSYGELRTTRASAVVVNASAWEDRDRDRLRAVLGKAWSPNSGVAAWPDYLNGIVSGSELEFPTAEEARSALIAFMNGKILAGQRPESIASLITKYPGGDGLALPEDNYDLVYARQFVEALAKYLDLEARYARDPSSSTLRQLASYVADYGQVNPDWPSERTERILEVIGNQQLFVPPTILFGEYVFPYREATEGLVAYAGEPEYTFEETGARARFDFGVPLVVERIDFESAGLTSIEWIADGKVIAKDDTAPIMAPLLAPNATAVTTLEVVARGASERATLRKVRAGISMGAVASVNPVNATAAPRIDGRLEEACWSGPPATTGFTREKASEGVAAVQTQAHLARRGDVLYIAIACSEPRMSTMEATEGPRDSVVWPRESVMIEFGGRGDFGTVVAVNPNGVVYDSRDGDPLWNGAEQIATRRNADGWTVEIGMPLQAGMDAIRFSRYRFNVSREVSSATVTLKK